MGINKVGEVKSDLVGADELIIRDSAAAGQLRRLLVSQLTINAIEEDVPAFDPATGIKTYKVMRNTDQEIGTFTVKNGLDGSGIAVPPWDAAKEYDAQEVIIDETGAIYRSIQASNINNPVTDEAFWQVISLGVVMHDATVTYTQGSHCIHGGEVFVANTEIASKAFVEGTGIDEWTKIGASPINRYVVGADYLKGDYVVQNSKIYVANNDIIASASFVSGTGLDEFTEFRELIPRTYNTNGVAIPQGTVMIHDGELVVSTTEIPDGTAYAAGFGNEQCYQIGASLILPHNPDADYLAGDTCVAGGKIYVANTDMSAVAFASGLGANEWSNLGNHNVIQKFNPMGVYSMGDHVVVNGTVYMSNNSYDAVAEDAVNGVTFVSGTGVNEWSKLGSSDMEHDDTATYQKNSQVKVAGQLFISNTLMDPSLPSNGGTIPFVEGHGHQQWTKVGERVGWYTIDPSVVDERTLCVDGATYRLTSNETTALTIASGIQHVRITDVSGVLAGNFDVTISFADSAHEVVMGEKWDDVELFVDGARVFYHDITNRQRGEVS